MKVLRFFIKQFNKHLKMNWEPKPTKLAVFLASEDAVSREKQLKGEVLVQVERSLPWTGGIFKKWVSLTSFWQPFLELNLDSVQVQSNGEVRKF